MQFTLPGSILNAPFSAQCTSSLSNPQRLPTDIRNLACASVGASPKCSFRNANLTLYAVGAEGGSTGYCGRLRGCPRASLVDAGYRAPDLILCARAGYCHDRSYFLVGMESRRKPRNNKNTFYQLKER